MRTFLVLALALPLVAQDAQKPADQEAAATTAATDATGHDKTVEGYIDAGYRWVDFRGGSFDTYRSVVNLGEGPKLFDVDALIRSADRKYFDKLTIKGTGWGGDPYTTARLDVFKERTYDWRVDYRNIAYYNFLPSFADPLLAQGMIFTEQAWDTRIRTLSTEIRLLPGTRLVPYFAYDRNSNDGSGITTFETDANQYPVSNSVSSYNDSYRGGVQIQLTKFHATTEVGGNSFHDGQVVSYSGQPIFGNRMSPYFGQQLSLSSLAQNYLIGGESVFARGLVSYSPTSWLDLSGQFLYSQPKRTVYYNQTNTGNFVDQSTILFYTSQQVLASAAANQPHSTGSFLVDFHPTRRLRVLDSLVSDHFHVASSAVLTNVTDINPTPVPLSDVDRMIVNYNRHQTEVLFDVMPYLTLRGGFRYVWGDAQTEPSLTTTPTGPFQTVDLKQTIGLVGFQFRAKQRLTINGDLEVGTTSRAFFRTSLYNYHRSSVRGRYQVSNAVSLTVTQSLTANTNPTPGNNLDFLYSQTSVGLQWIAAKRVTVMADYTYSRLRSDITYLIPQTLTSADSVYRDNANTVTGMIEGTPVTGAHTPRLSAGGSYFKSNGTRPTAYYQPQARISFPITEHIQWNTEWRWYSMSEAFYTFEGFRAHVFMTSLRLTR
jgi:hypothetical protein